jgi:hypothetical protein
MYSWLTRLASGSRQVCEFLESETAFGDTILGFLLFSVSLLLRRLRPIPKEAMLMLLLLEAENDRLLLHSLLRPPFQFCFPLEALDPVDDDGTLTTPIAAIDAIF